MRKLILIIIISCSLPAFSANWGKVEIQNDPAGNDGEYVLLVDSAGNKFLVEDGLNIADEEAAKIVKVKDILFSWETIKIKECRFYFEAGILNAMVIPDSAQNDSLELAPYLSAGMLFILDNETLVYNFRIKKDKYFLRINGAYISEKLLSDKIAEAVKAPQTFVQRRDPDYLLTAIDRITNENDQLKKAVIAFQNAGFFSKSNPIDPKIIDRIVSIKWENRNFTSKEIEAKAKEENLKVSKSEIDLILSVYFNEFAK